MSAADTVDDLYPPPDDVVVNQAIQDYARAVRDAYGERVRGIYLFGSRARGDHTPESDADIAVVLEDGDWDFWEEKMLLTDLTYDLLIATGADLQGWPVRQSQWVTPELGRNAELVRAMRRDGRPVWPL
jgi:antitoxin ChpS